MTLLAAFTIHDIPILIGDFLLTDEQVNTNHIFYPTRPELKGVKPGPGERRICGLSKKIHIIGERLAVGFTGQMQPGRYLLKQLYKKFSHEKPNARNLSSFLRTLRYANKSKTELTGWIWEKRPLCFHWKGSSPGDLNFSKGVFTGSGGNHFKSMLTNADNAGLSPNIQTALDSAIYIGSCNVGKLFFEELSSAENLKHHYGYGAEMVLWDGSRFFYNEKLTFIFWNILIDPKNNLHIVPANVCAAYKNFGAFSAIQVTHLEPKKNGTPGLQAENTYIQIVTPIYDNMNGFDPRSVGRIPFESGLCYSGLLLQNPTKNLSSKFSIVSECSNEIESFTWFKDDMLYLNLKQLKERLPPNLLN